MSERYQGASNYDLIVLFDGHCLLCERSVHFIVRHDVRASFKFAAAQSEVGARLQAQYDIDALQQNTFALIRHGVVLTRSAAAIGVARHLDGAWKLCALAWVVPRPLRDWLYEQVARRRYRWFGERESCVMPSAELAPRFLAD